MKKSYFFVAVGLGLSITLGAGQSGASELVFGFQNPSFGGNPFMGRHLLDTANTQNTFKDPAIAIRENARANKDETAEFEKNLKRQLLSRLARTIIDSAFGEAGLQIGTHVIGDNTIEVSETADGGSIQVVITSGSGSTTEVIVPRF